MSKWGPGYSDLARNAILNGISKGAGPKTTAGKLRQYVEDMPTAASDTLMRTLQLNSYRDASLAMEQMNSAFITKKIRMATLDDVTCLSCIALDGTEMDPGEEIDDHYNGRCYAYYVVPGGDETPDQRQADSEPGNRNFIPYQTGSDWFDSLSPERQAEQSSFASSPAKLAAYQDGIPLSAFVGDHEDSVFGHQFVENSLVGAIGDKAQDYYK
jgi:hypothetical protein